MLLINGVHALIGMLIAYIVYQIQVYNDLKTGSLILLCGLALWMFLFICDVVEAALIKKFNRDDDMGAFGA